MWAAVFAAATLFLDAAHQTAEALALPVNEAEAEGSLRYLYRVRELPADASEIFEQLFPPTASVFIPFRKGAALKMNRSSKTVQ